MFFRIALCSIGIAGVLSIWAEAAPLVLEDVPAYYWYHGCGPTAAAAVFGYWDLNGFDGLFEAAGAEVFAGQNVQDRISSPQHNAKYDPTPDDPDLPVPEDTSIACWFGTSVDPLAYGWSYLWRSDDAFEGYSAYRGYPFESWYEAYGGTGLTWEDLRAEIDAGRPMMFLVDTNGDGVNDHFAPVLGYDDRGAAGLWYGCYTTWSESETVVWKEFTAKGQPWGVGYGVFVRPPILYWQGGDGRWETPENWSGGPPGREDNAWVDNGGQAEIRSGIATGRCVYVGYRQSGQILQSGGTAAFSQELCLGRQSGSWGGYELSDGYLEAAKLTVGRNGAGEISLPGPAGELSVSGMLTLGPHSRLLAAPGSRIRLNGGSLENRSGSAADLAGLTNVALTIDGGGVQPSLLEVAGRDLGPDRAGWEENFALGSLRVGGDGAGWLELLDSYDNQPGWREALYVFDLSLAAGAKLDLGDLALYYLNGGEPKRLIPGDANLDGSTDLGDLSILAGHWQLGGQSWSSGDLNGDGAVTVADLSILAGHWNVRTAGPAVPEPHALGALAFGGLALCGRGRLRRS